MKTLGYIGAFKDTRGKITDAIDDFCQKHNIKLSRKEMNDLAEDITDAAETERA